MKYPQAYIDGYFTGDGAASLHRGQEIVADLYGNEDDLQRVREAVTQLGWRTRPRGHSSSTWRWTVPVAVHEEMRSRGIVLPASSSMRAVPRVYQTAEEGQKVAFLEGLFDSDGSVDLKRDHSTTVRYSTVSSVLAITLVRLLASLGIVASCRSYNMTRYRPNNLDQWQIRVRVGSMLRFKSLITLQEKKQRKLQMNSAL